MPTTRLLLAALLALLVVLAPAATAAPAQAAGGCRGADTVPASASDMSRARSATLCLLNRERRERGRASLTRSRQLERSARAYSERMVNERFFAHEAPDGRGLVERIRDRTGYLVRTASWAVGENLAWGSGGRATPREIVRSWMNSPGHQRNILDRRFRHLGIGIALGAPRSVGEAEAATYTTHFGRRARR
ncbi:MAG TPA: CAP domain-containing protein [Solirubrobacteraceae bacterium]|nr:CAP domain-containing protein [Solirubrobacteraceae bacterium]